MLFYLDQRITIPVCDLCIIGAGPVGVALASAAEASGMSVLLVESGKEAPSAATLRLLNASIENRQAHAEMEVASCRALGGTTWWWGGRCVPLDAYDFESRSYVPDSEWPCTWSDIEPWYEKAASFFGIGDANFVHSSAAVDMMGTSTSRIEKWAPVPNIALSHRQSLESSTKIFVLLNATVSALEVSEDGRRIGAIAVANDIASVRIPVRRCVLACGGIATTQLLLLLQYENANILPSGGDVLGRYYMGHISGKIADIVLNDPGQIRDFDFEFNGIGYVRRRITISEEVMRQNEILNIAFWPDNPRFSDAGHRNGVLSLIWLVLRVPLLGAILLPEGVRLAHVGPGPHRHWAHIMNVLRSPKATFLKLFEITKWKYLDRVKIPGFLIRNDAGRYALHYHAEQSPNKFSIVKLSSSEERPERKNVSIDLQYRRRDAESVVRAHKHLDGALRQSGVGYLVYKVAEEDLVNCVLQQASDGFHQMGTTRMSKNPRTGVVDPNCQVHGLGNLYAVGSSVFTSSGQANPTFFSVALAFRLASHLVANGTG